MTARGKKTSTVTVRVVQLVHAAGLPLPAYQSAGAAGLDLLAAVPERKPVTLSRGRHALIPTGLAIALPEGFEAQVRPRSGLAAKHGVTVLNSPGTIDADYRGEVQVILVNHGPKPFTVRRGERIAQMVIAPVMAATLVATRALDTTARGAGGFGSTGRKTAAAKKSRKKRTDVPAAARVPKRRSPSRPRAGKPASKRR